LEITEWLFGNIPAQNSVLFVLLAMVEKQMFCNELSMVPFIPVFAAGVVPFSRPYPHTPDAVD
jgi:hypothetical protein